MKKLFTISIILLISFLVACSGEKIDTNMSEEVADFNFTTQDNEQFGLKDLEGEWWVAYFMYTNCTIVCPTTTPHMVSAQNKLSEDGLNPQIVSFSVDPEHDTPDVLQEYADEYEADLDNWAFLTGYEFDEIQDLAEDSFKTVLDDGGPDSHEYSHSTYFYLVNPDGEIIKRYDGMSYEEMDLLVNDLKEVM